MESSLNSSVFLYNCLTGITDRSKICFPLKWLQAIRSLLYPDAFLSGGDLNKKIINHLQYHYFLPLCSRQVMLRRFVYRLSQWAKLNPDNVPEIMHLQDWGHVWIPLHMPGNVYIYIYSKNSLLCHKERLIMCSESYQKLHFCSGVRACK